MKEAKHFSAGLAIFNLFLIVIGTTNNSIVLTIAGMVIMNLWGFSYLLFSTLEKTHLNKGE